MKRRRAPVGSAFARFGYRAPHYLSRVTSYRGGTRL